MNDQTGLAITKLTTTYSSSQDRICLAMASADGRSLALWLTQRLANRFVDQICNWLKSNAAGVTQTALPETAAAIASSMAQGRAVANIAPTPPVNLEHRPNQGLIENINCKLARGGAQLTFSIEGGREVATTTYSADAMRQWLHMLHRAYVQAEWPLAAWPHWFLDAVSDQPPGERQLH